ncbi:hypothetical protein GCM10007887_23940 [Methylobacterium haplocladii]|uniref:Uncharacterized protein n=1 Tax=Methylobacterium haplocladii TaxID=1176176 RepID=A0A512IVK3_9HYPH|nr:hypothetical protein MHA02_41290 [Methylobacterium haplocladii]GLS59723.1 hypothetical protein GCM10007887_23940 [Methylobacterium haplocladii]
MRSSSTLPPYSSRELYLIEQAFAKLKALLRSAAARTVTDLKQGDPAGHRGHHP